jgi:predicted DNA-binding transcriptional regulator AlpA
MVIIGLVLGAGRLPKPLFPLRCGAMSSNTPEATRVPSTNRRLLRLPEVRQKVGLSRSAIYKLIAEGQSPRQIPIGPSTVAW